MSDNIKENVNEHVRLYKILRDFHGLGTTTFKKRYGKLWKQYIKKAKELSPDDSLSERRKVAKKLLELDMEGCRQQLNTLLQKKYEDGLPVGSGTLF